MTRQGAGLMVAFLELSSLCPLVAAATGCGIASIEGQSSEGYELSLGAGTVTMSPGESVLLYAAPADSRGRVFTGLQTITWSSSSPAVVSVTQSGALSALAVGDATVTAKAIRLDTGASASASVAVRVTGAGTTTDAGVSGAMDAGTAGGEPVDAAMPPPPPPGPTPGESEMPLWRQGMAVGEWRAIAGTALSSAPRAVIVGGNTGPQSKVVAWTGFVVDTRNSAVYSLANGGHHDYSGNEVNRIALLDNAPKWTEPRAATPTAQQVENTTHYTDGRPTSRHTYYGTSLNEVRNRGMVLGGAGWGNGGAVGAVDGFHLAANDWDSAGTYPNPPSDFLVYPACAATDEKSTGDIYVFCNYAAWRLNSAANAWTKVLGQSVWGQYAASALDTKRRRILLQGGDLNEKSVFDLATSTMQTITFTGPNAAAMTGDSGNGMVYEPALDAYLLRKGDAGGTVYRINAQTFSVDTLPTTNGAAVPATTNGVWRRFLYVPQLKGVIYFPTYDGNAFFLRTN